MNNPLISIITVVYNGQRHIGGCIKNVIAQNCPQAEHVIIDGSSTDKTVAIIKEFAKTHPHIRFISEKDKGQSDALNKGLSLSQGRIIGILNCDDFYEPGVINEIVRIFAKLPEPSVLVGNCRILDDDGKLLELNKPRDLSVMGFLLDWDLNAIPCNPSAYFYHKSLHFRTGLYNVDEHYAMDQEFLFKAVRMARTKYVDQIFGNWRFIKGCKTYEAMIRGEMDKNCKRVKQECLATLPFYHPAKIPILRWLATRLTYYSRNPRKLLRQSKTRETLIKAMAPKL